MAHICSRSLGSHGCGECLRNRVYQKRVWCHRMDLEARCHAENSFLTLTYDDLHLPHNGSLQREHVTNWLKKLRQDLHNDYGIKVRYFLVGEYGDISNRPHYHAALFGIGPSFEDVIRKTWGMGHVMLAELNIATIRYIAGYVTKKLAVNDQNYAESGVEPEWQRMSKGLGRGYVPSITAALDCEAGASLLSDDVPTSLILHGRPMPLGRYLRTKLKDAQYDKDPHAKIAQLIGSESVYNSKKKLKKHDEKMQSLYETYARSSMAQKMTFLDWQKHHQKQKFLNSESSFKLHKKDTL